MEDAMIVVTARVHSLTVEHEMKMTSPTSLWN
jgi:hypothetical protein